MPRKLSVPVTLLPIIELMMSMPKITGRPPTQASIRHLDGKGKVIGKANLSLILRIWKIPHNNRKYKVKWVNY